MLSPFGIIRFSCSLLVHCFVKSKRRRRRGCSNRRLGGADEDAVALPPTAVCAAKSAIAKVTIHVKPLRPVGKPCCASFLSLFLNNKPLRQPVIQPSYPQIDTEMQMDDERRRRRTCGDYAARHQVGMEASNVASLGSWSSDEEYDTEDSGSDADSFVFGDLCPRTSSETSSTRKGFNPTFYGVDVSDEEDPGLLHQSAAFRRLNSVVERDARLKENAHTGTRQLLLNPAYGVTREESDVGDSDVQMETKLKTLKSLAKTGCLALPASTALVGNQYIGHTSLNPTYGDITSSSSEEDSDLSSEDSLQFSNNSPFEQKAVFALERLHQLDRISPSSLPMASFREMADSGVSENMGTLTWSNVVFSHSEDSDEQTVESHEDLQNRWREILRADIPEDTKPTLRPSPFADPSTGLQALHFNLRNESTGQSPRGRVSKQMVTPIQSIAHDGFEDINIKCPPAPHTPPSRHLKHCVSVSSPKGCSNFLTSGMKHTRGLLRWFYLLLIRIDGFLTDKKN